MAVYSGLKLAESSNFGVMEISLHLVIKEVTITGACDHILDGLAYFQNRKECTQTK